MTTAPESFPRGRDAAPISNRRSDRPTLLVTPTKQTKTPQISNREALRLEIDVTSTKQRPDLGSNRELEPLFEAHPAPIDRPISNREALRLETDVTSTKQRPDLSSNREFAALSPGSANPSETRLLGRR
jgi:hypothetical protein